MPHNQLTVCHENKRHALIYGKNGLRWGVRLFCWHAAMVWKCAALVNAIAAINNCCAIAKTKWPIGG
jgi:hypothetical protein